MSGPENKEFEFIRDDGSSWADDTPRGLLVTFEGGEGTGKSTQAARLVAKMEEYGIPVEPYREPGSSNLGDYVREWVKRTADTTPLAETLLLSASRAQMCAQAVRPALRRGVCVVLDRFTDSTLAYQGYGRKLSIELIEELNGIATGGLVPDLTVLLELDPGSALARVNGQGPLDIEAARIKRRLDPENERRFENEPESFHQRVLNGYRELAKCDRGRWAVISADQPAHRIADAIWKRVRRLLVESNNPPYLRYVAALASANHRPEVRKKAP